MVSPVVVIVVVPSESAPPRRQVAVGNYGPGIARIIVDELFARANEIEAVGEEVAS